MIIDLVLSLCLLSANTTHEPQPSKPRVASSLIPLGSVTQPHGIDWTYVLSSGAMQTISIRLTASILSSHGTNNMVAGSNSHRTNNKVAGSNSHRTNNMVAGSNSHQTNNMVAGSNSHQTNNMVAGSNSHQTNNMVAGSNSHQTNNMVAGSNSHQTKNMVAGRNSNSSSNHQISNNMSARSRLPTLISITVLRTIPQKIKRQRPVGLCEFFHVSERYVNSFIASPAWVKWIVPFSPQVDAKEDEDADDQEGLTPRCQDISCPPRQVWWFEHLGDHLL